MRDTSACDGTCGTRSGTAAPARDVRTRLGVSTRAGTHVADERKTKYDTDMKGQPHVCTSAAEGRAADGRGRSERIPGKADPAPTGHRAPRAASSTEGVCAPRKRNGTWDPRRSVGADQNRENRPHTQGARARAHTCRGNAHACTRRGNARARAGRRSTHAHTGGTRTRARRANEHARTRRGTAHARTQGERARAHT